MNEEAKEEKSKPSKSQKELVKTGVFLVLVSVLAVIFRKEVTPLFDSYGKLFSTPDQLCKIGADIFGSFLWSLAIALALLALVIVPILLVRFGAKAITRSKKQ